MVVSYIKKGKVASTVVGGLAGYVLFDLSK